MRQVFERYPAFVIFGVVLVVAIGSAILVDQTIEPDGRTPADALDTSSQQQTPVGPKRVPLDALETDMGVDRVVNARLGVDLSRDSGAMCERVSRTRFACGVVTGDESIASGWWIRCPPPLSLDDWAAWCSLSQRMTPEERCVIGIRSGDPFTNKEIWDEEAVICRDLGVPID